MPQTQPELQPPGEHRRYTKWTDENRPVEPLANRLRDAGVRPTPTRCDVLAALHSESGPSVPHTAAEVFRKVARPGFVLANVYRILGELEAAGLVQRSVPEAGRAGVFVLRSAVQPGYLACTRCHAVGSVMDEWMQDRLRSLATAKGLTLERYTWRMHGLCDACAASKPAQPRQRAARATA